MAQYFPDQYEQSQMYYSDRQPLSHQQQQQQQQPQQQHPQFVTSPQLHSDFHTQFHQQQQRQHQHQPPQPSNSYACQIPADHNQGHLNSANQALPYHNQPQTLPTQFFNGSDGQPFTFYGHNHEVNHALYYQQSEQNHQHQYQQFPQQSSPPPVVPLQQQQYMHPYPQQFQQVYAHRNEFSSPQISAPQYSLQHQTHQQELQSPQVESKPQALLNTMRAPPQVITSRPHSASRVLQDVQPNATKPQATKSSQDIEIDIAEPNYAALLLTMADEYIEAANKLSQRTENYYKLVAISLACMESVLKNFKLAPIREAQVSLRYSQLLYSETTNYDEAETVLTKAVDLCNRLKFWDLKYAMQLLLAKVLFQSKPRAAIRDLQGMIADLETYHHAAWEYAFRFQHVIFSLNPSAPFDVSSALSNLEKIQHTARQHGDHAIFAFAATMESLLHLHVSGSEALSLAQAALAKARSLQLNPDVEKALQLSVLAEFIDLYCCTQSYDFVRIEEKRKILQDTLYKAIESTDWNSLGLIILPVSARSLGNIPIQDGGLVFEEKGKHYMAFSWLDKDEVEAVAFLLCGDSIAYKFNENGNTKAERYMVEGMRIPREMLSKVLPCSGKDEALHSRWRTLTVHFLLQAVFLQSSRGQWTKAQNSLREAETWMKGMASDIPPEIEASLIYLKGINMQGIGKTDEALKSFQSEHLDLFQYSTKTQTSGKPLRSSHNRNDETLKHLAMLAAMNSALIIHSQHHPQHYLLQNLMNELSPLVQSSHNKNIQASYSFLLSVLPNNTILRTKQYLNHALTTAKAINNHQIVGLTLTVMQEKFFKGVVPDQQAIKCAKAATHQVKSRWGDPMWLAVAAGLEADCLEMLGDQAEAMNKRTEAIKAMAMAPERIRQASG